MVVYPFSFIPIIHSLGSKTQANDLCVLQEKHK